MERKRLVIGNAAIDGFLRDDVNIEVKKDSVILRHGGNVLEIFVRNGPIKPGGKYTSIQNFFNEAQVFPREDRFGGGGYNSATNLRKVTDEKISYLDISTPSLDTAIPGKSLADRLKSMDIEPYFLSARPIPFNLVFGNRSDKIIIKSRIGDVTLSEYHPTLVNAIVNDSYGMLMNSVKDIQIAELIIKAAEEKRNLVSIITNSLDPDFVKERLIPVSICQFNYDEFGDVMGYSNGDEECRIGCAIDGIRKIRKDITPTNNIYVTLGKNGVLCSAGKDIFHVMLKDGKLADVNECVSKNPSAKCGAGDAFGGRILKMEFPTIYPIDKNAIFGCISAINHIGYPDVSQDDFIVRRV